MALRIEQLPTRPGTYILQLTVPTQVPLQIGRLGRFTFATGDYFYVGSAFGPGGLRRRLDHHLNSERTTRPHWHLDYFRAISRITTIWYTTDPRQREHEWAEILRGLPTMTIPVPRFGASDCRCAAHFFRITSPPPPPPASLTSPLTRRSFARRVHRAIPHHAPVNEFRVPPHR